MTRFAGGPVESPGFLLWHATLRWQRAITSALAPLGLTHVQFVVLACTWWAYRSGDVPNQAAVASRAGTDPKMTSEVLVRLEAKGLITRIPDASDARAKLLRVTAPGEVLAERAIAVVEDVDAGFFGDNPTRDTVALLQRLAAVAP